MDSKTEILKLFSKRIALIVDDQVSDKGSQAFKIKNEFEDAGMVFTTYEDIPAEKQWDGLSEISFALIDWELKKEESCISDLGLPNGPGITAIQEEGQERLTRFIVELMSKYLVPVIIFTQQDTDYVTKMLEKSEKVRCFLDQGQAIVYDKNRLEREKIEDILYSWCKSNPSVYALISISNSINTAKIDMFTQLGSFDNMWPVAIYQTLELDKPEDINQEFAEFMISSLIGRVDYPLYDQSIFNVSKEFDAKELIRIYSSAKLYKYNNQTVTASTGDLYICKDDEDSHPENFILNITAGCDIRSDKQLFIKGEACKKIQYDETYGLVNKSTSNYVPMLCGNICVEFKFRTYKRIKKRTDMSVVKFGDKEYKRVGRLMHPYITEIQERFSSFISRHGIIRHPDSVLSTLSPQNT